MENLTISRNNDTLTISLNGCIDSVFTNNHNDYIIGLVQPTDHVIFNLENTEYISSTGLRLILKCAKLAKLCEVNNCHPSVYEIFEISGFTSILKVRKALREVSVEGKTLLGEGANGKVYRYNDDTIIKVFKNVDNIANIEHEIEITKKAFVLGIPTAIPFAVVKIKEGGFGSMYELLKSATMDRMIIENPEKLPDYLQDYAKIIEVFANTKIEKGLLPDRKEFFKKRCEFFRENAIFASDICDKLESLINSIPDTNNLCHGDLHIKNVMFQNGEPIIIDMDTLSTGHPIFELAFIYYTLVLFDKNDPANTEKFFGIKYEVCTDIAKRVIDLVLKDKTPEEKESILEKIIMMAHIRVVSSVYHHTPINQPRLQMALDYINYNINKIDSLSFEL